MVRRTYGGPNGDWVPHTLPGVVVDVRLPKVAWQTCARYEPGLESVGRIFGDEGWVRGARRSPNVTARDVGRTQGGEAYYEGCGSSRVEGA